MLNLVCDILMKIFPSKIHMLMPIGGEPYMHSVVENILYEHLKGIILAFSVLRFWDKWHTYNKCSNLYVIF